MQGENIKLADFCSMACSAGADGSFPSLTVWEVKVEMPFAPWERQGGHPESDGVFAISFFNSRLHIQ
jgi:hypothetical protein